MYHQNIPMTPVYGGYDGYSQNPYGNNVFNNFVPPPQPQPAYDPYDPYAGYNYNSYDYNPSNFLQTPQPAPQTSRDVVFYEYEIVDKKKEKKWANKQLSKRGLCLCQRWLFMLVGNLFLLAMTLSFIGIFLYINTPSASATAPLTYNDNCTQGSTQCNTYADLYCPSGKCVCNSNKVWNGTDCTCPNDQYWDGYNCLSCISYGGACSSSVPCLSYLTCDSTFNTCNCTTTKYYVTGKCLDKLTYGINCTSYVQCQTYNSLTCSKYGNCSCYSQYYWNGITCVAQKLNGSSCASTIECNSALGLSCSSQNLCLCSSLYYWNGASCVPKGQYGGSGCTADYMCDGSRNLTCFTSGTACTCPNTYNFNVCDCASGLFYDSSSCVAKKATGAPCPAGYGCTSGICVSGYCT